jgi:hypothetical protein
LGQAGQLVGAAKMAVRASASAEAVGADPEPLIREYGDVRRAPGALPAVSLDELFTPVQISGRRTRAVPRKSGGGGLIPPAARQ